MSSDMIRVTGINSGLDTESIISAYTSTAKKRVQDAKNSKTLNTWTQDAWKSINTKIYSFYSGTLASNRLSSAYSKTKVTTSSSCLSVVAGAGAVKGVQTAKIKSTASAAYLTGGKIDVSSEDDNLLEKLNIKEGSTIKFKDAAGSEKTIQIGGTSDDENVAVVSSMKELVKAFGNCGVNANFDAGNNRIFLSAKSTGENFDFDLEDGGDGTLAKLGLATKDQGGAGDSAAVKMAASSAELELNGATFKSDTNSFTINGSTYTINAMPTTDENISITTATDYDGVYDVVRDMLSEYNKLVNEMSKLYNAESSKGYDPLTDEQKKEMSEDEIKEWEDKIKGALLKGNNTLYEVMNAMTNTAMEGFEVNGKKMYLADFGISTLGYFDAEENERYALHINGDEKDGSTSGNEDKLKSLIASDPEAVTSFFSQLSAKMYDNLYEKMGSTKLSSIYKVYNDKQLKTEASEWDKKIAELESKLSDMEDRYYKKFSTMETALAKINSNSSSIASFFGG